MARIVAYSNPARCIQVLFRGGGLDAVSGLGLVRARTRAAVRRVAGGRWHGVSCMCRIRWLAMHRRMSSPRVLHCTQHGCSAGRGACACGRGVCAWLRRMCVVEETAKCRAACVGQCGWVHWRVEEEQAGDTSVEECFQARLPRPGRAARPRQTSSTSATREARRETACQHIGSSADLYIIGTFSVQRLHLVDTLDKTTSAIKSP